jgi:uncharacterized protein YecE (DUF72 family)
MPSFRVGTSGWQYRDWRGRFYPAELAQRAWLEHYATSFDTVEVNNSFYRLPEASTFAAWRARTPVGFLFAVKASRYITHVRRLRAPREPVDLLLERASALGDALGPVLFQLPPNFGTDVDRLQALLDAVAGRVRPALEFRHPSWFRDDVYDVLDGSGAALVLVDRAGAHTQPVVTGGWSYVRFHQGTRSTAGYRRDTLERWADLMTGLDAREVFVYFNNDAGAAAPRDAGRLVAMLRRRGAPVSWPSASERRATGIR